MVTKEVRGRCIAKYVTVQFGKDNGLAGIRVIARFVLTGSIVLFRRQVPRLRSHPLTELLSTMPNRPKLLMGKRRVALVRFLQKHLPCFYGVTKTFDDFPSKVGQGTVP